MHFDLQGHRGAAGLLPENTIPSFIRAIDLGVQTIEFDVLISGDGQVVITHDPWFRRGICSTPEGDLITRETEADYRIYNLPYDSIARFDCGSHGNPNHPDQEKMQVAKPLMREAILEMEKYVKENKLKPVYYSIETKSRPDWDRKFHPEPDEFMQLVYGELSSLNVLDRVIIQSFDVRTLQRLRSLDPSVTQALLVSQNNDLQENIHTLGYIPGIYSPNYATVDPEMIALAHSLGMKIIPWTVNDPEDIEKLIDMGVDGLITDYPDRFSRYR
ncbi:MAG: glycerophosphodiester phosphodiesterase family protein [Balneolales bacterium]